MRAGTLGLAIFLVGATGPFAPADAVTVAGRTYRRYEFGLSDGTSPTQKRPSLAWSSDGRNFTATWDTGYWAYARRFAEDGTPLTPDIVVGGYVSGQSETWYTDVAALPGGASMVVTEHHPSYYVMDIYGRGLAADGGHQTGFFQVNTYTSGPQKYPQIDADAAGRSLVVWQTYWPAGDDLEIAAQRLDAAGHPLGDEFLVNGSLTGQQDFPKVAMAPDGLAMAVWRTGLPTGGSYRSTDIRARRFAPSGEPCGEEFIVSAAKSGISSMNPAVAMNAPGHALVAWEESPRGSGNSRVYVQRYDPLGQAVGDPVQVTDRAYAASTVPNVALWDDGEFVVTWYGDGDDGSEVWARLFDAAGGPLSDPFVVTLLTAGNQHSPRVACGTAGRMAFVWQDGTTQSYATVYVPEPATLSLLALGGLAVLVRRSVWSAVPQGTALSFCVWAANPRRSNTESQSGV